MARDLQEEKGVLKRRLNDVCRLAVESLMQVLPADTPIVVVRQQIERLVRELEGFLETGK